MSLSSQMTLAMTVIIDLLQQTVWQVQQKFEINRAQHHSDHLDHRHRRDHLDHRHHRDHRDHLDHCVQHHQH